MFASATVASDGNITTNTLSSAATTWDMPRLQQEFVGDDPWQSFNRSMFALDEAMMTYVARPLSKLYSSLVPRPVIKGVERAVDNSEYGVRLGACLLRSEWGGAWDETKRFCLNTTVGLGGFFDPARDWFGIHSTDASISGTLAAWDIAPGPALVIPCIPRANTRDAVGYILDQGLDPKTYVSYFFPTGIWLPWTATLWPNYAAVWSDPWESAITPNADPYTSYLRVMTAKSLLDEDLAIYHYLNEVSTGTAVTRRPPVRDLESRPANIQGKWRDIADYNPRSPALDSLRQRLFVPMRDKDAWWMRDSIFNTDFARDVDERSIVIDPAFPVARYGFVPAPANGAPEHRQRIVFIIPGVGSSHASQSTLAMGEMMHNAGVPTVLCDNPFHWEYMQSANRGILPGNLPEDARRFAAYMRAVLADLSQAGLVADPEVSIVGWSMGGLITTHLAALQQHEDLGFRTGPMLAVNAPVSFDTVTTSLESFLAPTQSWTPDEVRENFVEIGRRLAVWEETRFAPTPDISEKDARFTVSLALSASLPELVGLATRTNESIPVRDYFCRHVRAAYPDISLDTLQRQTSLISLEKEMQAETRLMMIHTRDDFLVNDAERAYLDRTLGDRITWFSSGAHCGMFHTPEFRNEVLNRLNLQVCGE
ncbi:MAG: alpha/beta fold hydrolase [Kiritimatiellae bacterium]|nr:alpha/beta fold hydrolase [Kiritimatiellia bacterium]